LLFQKVYRDVRRALTRHFPYAIYFVVTADRVSVLRILHQARSPEEWQRET
jgi:plasmid stabilization system protein ParE